MKFEPSAEDPRAPKLKELMLYVAKRSETDPHFGATKLNKLLVYADFVSYLRCGKAITEYDHQKLPQGPALRAFLPIRNEMIAAREAAIQVRDHFGKQQKRLVALREPDLKRFSGAEIAIVNEVIEMFLPVNASQISELSHMELGWQAAEIGETIPLETILLSDRDLTDEETEYGRQLAATCR